MSKVSFQNQFGETIRGGRIKADLSLREAAKKIGISRSYLSSLEINSDGHVPPNALIEKICEIIGLDFKKLQKLSAQISGLKSFKKKLNQIDANNIEAFYQVSLEGGLSTGKALEIFKDAIRKQNGIKERK